MWRKHMQAEVVCRPHIQDKEAWPCGGNIRKRKTYVDLTSKQEGLALWREHMQAEVICRPYIQARRLGPVEGTYARG